MSVATANTAGYTKKITTSATLLIGYCLGNFVGPFFFKAEQAPRYPLGVAMMLFCVVVKSEHTASQENEQQAYERGLLDETDLQSKYFKYVY
ncbi:hypothetical protein LX36DRAFT_714366 [Colletotrichum falcatum]|nr:hypothetical protein LX36DRAFT_714366 [Colletotrichum falcatum]